MYCGFDTQAAFIGHCPKLLAELDRITELEYPSATNDLWLGDLSLDPPAALAYMFKRRMISALIGKLDVRGRNVRYLEMVYAAVDDEILKYAIASGHVKDLKINGRGYYLANGGVDA
ncbi:hypothetical protein D3C85_149920 [compost metagenome]